jgi:membrane protease YdiL (CAAX protease family)
MKRIILFVALLEITYLALSFLLAHIFGQWSSLGEIIRTGLRVISIVFYGYFYQKYFYNVETSFKPKTSVTPQLIAAILLFLLFAVAYNNAQNETVLWQFIFVISGITAGLREELLYRGIIQNCLQTKYDHKIALFGATLIFTLSHVQYIYYGQFGGLMLITMAGLIFGCIFIQTGSIVLTAIIHGLYDALLSVDAIPFRLGNSVAIPIMFLITLAFLMIVSKKLYNPQNSRNTDDSNQDNLSLG